MNSIEIWERYRRYLCVCESIGLSVDVSRMRFDDGFFEGMAGPISRAFEAMDALEAGAVANPDEGRRVGHYWLRAPQLAPDKQITADLEQARQRIVGFAADVHAGRVAAPTGKPFANLLLLGIGGSALGPQFVSDALGTAGDPIRAYYCDNTDPDGFGRTFDQLGDGLARTLVLVVSKSGGTIETRNALLETAARYAQAGLDFPACAVAVTQDGSELHGRAEQEGWLAKFPMWDWVGGRTSVTSAVGILPAALQGFDVEALLAGAGDADAVTRSHNPLSNPAALLALMWFHATDGRGARDMVVIPYKDRLALFPKYLQQLIMESLGKERDLDGQAVCQGLTVYGNKGSTDQHAYVQQLRDGVHNFFVTFIGVRRDRCGTGFPAGQPTGWNAGATVWVEPEVTSGDYLHGFRLGTRQALWEKGRESITIMLDELTPRTVGVLIALYERAVGLYASLINVNAYDQPGVEAGKKAAAGVIDLQRRLLAELKSVPGTARTAEELAAAIGAGASTEVAHHILEHLAANPEHDLTRIAGENPWSASYHLAP